MMIVFSDNVAAQCFTLLCLEEEKQSADQKEKERK
jgi:hypothetical protein